MESKINCDYEALRDYEGLLNIEKTFKEDLLREYIKDLKDNIKTKTKLIEKLEEEITQLKLRGLRPTSVNDYDL